MSAKSKDMAFSALLESVEEYLREIDSPAPDYSYRRILRDQMRRRVKDLRAALASTTGEGK